MHLAIYLNHGDTINVILINAIFSYFYLAHGDTTTPLSH
jgi:hypothetical protein